MHEKYTGMYYSPVSKQFKIIIQTYLNFCGFYLTFFFTDQTAAYILLYQCLICLFTPFSHCVLIVYKHIIVVARQRQKAQVYASSTQILPCNEGEWGLNSSYLCPFSATMTMS